MQMIRGQIKHMNLFNMNLFGLHPNETTHSGPQKEVYVPHLLGKDAAKGPTSISVGGLLGPKTGSHGLFLATKSLVYSFFALNDCGRTFANAKKTQSSMDKLVCLAAPNTSHLCSPLRASRFR